MSIAFSFFAVAGLAVAGLVAVVAATDPPAGRTNQFAFPKAAPEGAAPPAWSAREVRGASPYVEIKDEPPPKLFVDEPLPEGLPLGVFWAQYRVENLHIAPVFGAGALKVSPRVGHLHVQVDDLWWWADASDGNTIDIANLAPGEHKVRIVLVDAAHNPFPGQEVTLRFTIPEGVAVSHSH